MCYDKYSKKVFHGLALNLPWVNIYSEDKWL